MTLEELQEQIHVVYEGDIDFPNETADEDFQIRRALICLAIREWEKTAGVYWRTLLAWASEDPSYERKIITNQSRYSLPVNFSKIYEGIIHLADKELSEVPINKVMEIKIPAFYISGNNNTGFFINFINLDTVKLTNEEFNFLYVKKATELVDLTDKTECPDPNYIIHRVASELFAQDSDPKASKELAMSQTILSGMIIENAATSLTADSTYEIA